MKNNLQGFATFCIAIALFWIAYTYNETKDNGRFQFNGSNADYLIDTRTGKTYWIDGDKRDYEPIPYSKEIEN
ncbi:hypothetical protein O3Q51_17050 [Cryomorphaceae bacterium 1068]|nr:hypothetical protein [Cryomorphaceae bacterium 1068]